ncbi:MAG: NAD-dependent epimerase/dehydratase family protein [Rhodospirillaceae bacterium]|jgi:GDP-4-dehydro-6-deoxy-D-mannose reductase|nr:NAD-dependent epimerase/dehydratase family protein [Rhodospirillaceae bacterium]MBT7487336.1 NAD-dependent epimerase/dehydratase family protein [Rhodospirillales bacterium]MBT7758855.1 NAD-dependent epimerase/dehydratase family protein [Rhodospirillaceae bacterium]
MGYLVTGARGFIGGHLLDRLRADGHQAHGISRGYGDDGRNQASHELTGDVRDQKQMQAILRQTRPDIIFHCAAQSYPGIAWKAPLDTFEANAVGTLSLLQSMIDVDLSPRVVICSSSAVYGSGNGRDPINESHALAPADPYGLSKVTQEEIGRYFVRNHSTDVVFARPFFVMGPRKEGDVCSDFAREIVTIESGAKDTISVGNLEVYRDFLDINDAVEAMLLLADRGKGGEAYNICSGDGQSIQSILDILMRHCKRPEISVSVAADKLRKNDLKYRVGDCEKLQALGWTAKVSLETSLPNILQYWRKRS